LDLFTDLFRQNLFEGVGASLIAFSLFLVRMLAFTHFAPIFSHKSVPSHVRIVISFLITTMLAPRLMDVPVPEEGYAMVVVIFVNFLLGFIMGFTTNILFITIVAGGEMMDASMGFSAAQTFDPGLNAQTTIIGKFFNVLSIVLFFYIGGPEMLLQGLSESVDSFSIYASVLDVNVDKIISLCGNIISMGFLLVSPVVLTILVNDIVLGLISRAAPQINAFQISFTIKPSIGVITLLMILPLFFRTVINFFSHVNALF
jgi:flagellar biosynthetic protein FliR